MRWFLLLTLAMTCGCGDRKSRPTAAEYQVELAELERLEKDLAAAQKNADAQEKLLQVLLDNMRLSGETAKWQLLNGDEQGHKKSRQDMSRYGEEAERQPSLIAKAKVRVHDAESAAESQRLKVKSLRELRSE